MRLLERRGHCTGDLLSTDLRMTMSLIEDIIRSAADNKQNVGSVLRKSLVLAYELKNQEFIDWLLRELNGYKDADDLPDFRKIHTISKGHFLGPAGAAIYNQPLPTGLLKPEHQLVVETAQIRQGVGALRVENENADRSGGSYIMDWSPNLTVLYQSAFFNGNHALNRAWQVIPVSAIVEIEEIVRTRVLQFALEIKQELENSSAQKVEDIPEEKIAANVTNIIFGGQNIVGSTTADVNQSVVAPIRPGNFEDLRSALALLNLSNHQIESLREGLRRR